MRARVALIPSLLAASLLAASRLAAQADDDPGDALLRQLIAETAAAQVKRVDPAWQEAQRDCAGLVRFAYRAAFARLRPATKGVPLFVDHRGQPADFADAEALVTKSFMPLGRGDDARRALRSGDLLAFRSERGEGEVVWHLMLVVVPAPGTEARVVYHPGEPGARVRTGTLAALLREAPLEWRPTPENIDFLGFFRFRAFIPAADAPLADSRSLGGPT